MAINIADNNPRIAYTGGAGQTEFAVPFVFYDSTDLTVYVDGAVVTPASVSGGSGAGGTVTLSVAYDGSEVVIVRDVPIERTTDLTAIYNADAIDNQLDRIAVQIADLNDLALRSITVNDYEVNPPLALPELDLRKGKVLGFNSSTGAIEATLNAAEVGTVASLSADISTLAGLSSEITALDAVSTEIGNLGGKASDITNVSNNIAYVEIAAVDISGANNIGAVGASIADVNDVADSLGEVTLVAGKLTNIDTVALGISNVNTVATNIAATNAVGGNISAVTGVNASLTQVGTVHTNIGNVNIVGNSIDDVNDVANSIANVSTVAADLADIGTVAGISNNVSTVAGISSEVTTVAGITGAIATVNTNEADIAAAAGAVGNINKVASSISNVNIVGANISNVNALGPYADDIGSVAGISSDVSTIAAEIDALVDIQGSVDAAAASAVTAATEASDAESARDQSQDARDQSQDARDTANLHKLAAEAAATSATSTAAALTGFDLEAIAATKAGTAIDVFVYDTSKDSDGGAWRKRTQGTSWYNETLNTATRGSRREFPAVAVIVAEATKVTIYDGDDPSLPMWMVLNVTGVISAVSALNGRVAVGRDVGVSELDFPADIARLQIRASSAGYEANILNRDSQPATTTSPEYPIINSNVNDVAMTVLPDAPIDPATGLPVPTIAVATAGGTSVITDSGDVYDSVSEVEMAYLGFVDVGLWFGRDTTMNFATYADIAAGDGFGDLRSSTGSPGSDRAKQPTRIRTDFTTSQNDLAYSGNVAPTGLGLTSVDYNTFGSSMSALLTSTYNTGWMNGNIKGVFLSDTDDTDLVESGELMTNGTFDTDLTGWTAEPNATATWNAGTMEVVVTTSNDWVYQAITTTVGATYQISFDFTKAGGGRFYVGTSIGSGNLAGASNTGSHVQTFVATTTTTYIAVGEPAQSGATQVVDNISVRSSDADRSVNANGLIVNGTVTRTPVATGADLVGYSGWNDTNYLYQPPNADLDFGIGDFSIMVWGKQAAASPQNRYIVRKGPTLEGWRFYMAWGTGLLYFNARDGVNNALVSSSATVDNKGFVQMAVCRRAGVLELYVNGELSGTLDSAASAAVDMSHMTASDLLVGIRDVGESNEAWANELALLRFSATAPTAEQIAKIYNDEKVLFQENAQATLYGSSDAVTALAHDDATNLLHVGTSAGRSVFQGLRRVSNTTTAVGTAISASNGLVVEE